MKTRGLPLVFVALASSASAHPVPNIPVLTSFEAGGACRVVVEVDPRCFDDDPLNEPYLLNWVLEEMDPGEREALLASARALISGGVAFRLEPSGPFAPDFHFAFTTKEGKPLKSIDDPVMLTGTWEALLNGQTLGYQIEIPETARYDVVFHNIVAGKRIDRYQVLFPGETSFLLDLGALATAGAAPMCCAPAAATGLALPLILTTAIVAAALIALRWARRNRRA